MKKKTNNIEQDVENINPYEVDKLSKIPSWLVIIILKYWAAAAAVFFIGIGGLDIGLDWSNSYDDPIANITVTVRMILYISIALALLGNYVIKSVVMLLHNRRNNARRYNFLNTKGFLSFIYYLVYMFIVSFILAFLNIWLSKNGWILNPFGTTNYGIEPFTYGLLFVIVDGVFVILKNIVVYIKDRVTYNLKINNKKRVIVNSDGTLSIVSASKANNTQESNVQAKEEEKVEENSLE